MEDKTNSKILTPETNSDNHLTILEQEPHRKIKELSIHKEVLKSKIDLLSSFSNTIWMRTELYFSWVLSVKREFIKIHTLLDKCKHLPPHSVLVKSKTS